MTSNKKQNKNREEVIFKLFVCFSAFIFAIAVLFQFFTPSQSAFADPIPQPTNSCDSNDPLCFYSTVEAVQNGLLSVDKVTYDSNAAITGNKTQFHVYGKTIAQVIKEKRNTTNWQGSASVEWTDFELDSSNGTDYELNDSDEIEWGDAGIRTVTITWDTGFNTGITKTNSPMASPSVGSTLGTQTGDFGQSNINPVKLKITFPVEVHDANWTPPPSPNPTDTSGGGGTSGDGSTVSPDQHPDVVHDNSNNLARTGLTILGLLILMGVILFIAFYLKKRRKDEEENK